jgi:hypothetical protein
MTAKKVTPQPMPNAAQPMPAADAPSSPPDAPTAGDAPSVDQAGAEAAQPGELAAPAPLPPAFITPSQGVRPGAGLGPAANLPPPGEESSAAVKEAEELRRKEYGAMRDGRAAELARQAASTGGVDHTTVNKAGEKAAAVVTRAFLTRRKPGVYVIEPCKLADENGHPREYPINTRLPDALVQRMGAAKLRELDEQGLIEDVRR